MTGPREKTRHQRAVEAFMVKAGQEIPERPMVPSEDILVLRARLILEEALEFVEAAGLHVRPTDGYENVVMRGDGEGRREHVPLRLESLVFESSGKPPDLVGMVDGCADISVVTTGTLSALGVADDPVQTEVDHNNLLKFVELGPCARCGGSGEVEFVGAVRDYTDPCPVCKGRGTLGGYRDEAGKWVKPAGHKPPDILRVLHDQGLAPQEWV